MSIGRVLTNWAAAVLAVLVASTNVAAATGKGAVHAEPDIRCQIQEDGQCHCGPFTRTGRQIPCIPQQQQQKAKPCSGPYIRNSQDLAKIVGDYETEPILIAALCSPPAPPNTWLVAMSGTQFRQGQPTGVEEIVETAFRLRDRYSNTVIASLNQMGVPPGANIILAGHSLGGMVAQNLQALPELGYVQRWRTVRVITFGSPIMNQLTVDRVARRFAVRGDPVVLEVNYWAARFGFRAMFYPPDISGLSKKPIWVDGGRAVDPIALHMAYGQSVKLTEYDALGDQDSQILEIDASQRRQFGRGLAATDSPTCPEPSQRGVQSPLGPRLWGTIGIPPGAVRPGDVLFGIYERTPAPALDAFAHDIGARVPQDLMQGDTPYMDLRTWPRYQTPDAVEWVWAFDEAVRERSQAHFDLNEMNIRRALANDSSYTSRELRWLRTSWATPIPGLGSKTFENLSTRPKFWCGGKQAKPPWRWANPDVPEYL